VSAARERGGARRDWSRVQFGRRAALTALVALPLAGAALTGGTHATESDTRFAAEATLLVHAGTGGEAQQRERVRGRVRVLAGVLRLPHTAAAARTVAGVSATADDVTRNLTVVEDPESGTIRVRVRAPSREQSVTLAGAVATEGIRLARPVLARGAGRPIEVVSDFEQPVTGWMAHPPLYNLPPERVTRITSGAHDGRGALRAECAAELGCGPWTRVERLFRAGTRYAATAYVRSPADGGEVKMVLGSTREDVQTGDAVELSEDWQRASVSWTPARDTTIADLGVQLTEARATVLDVDSVLLPDQGSVPGIDVPRELDVDDELRALTAGRFATVSPARFVGEQQRPPYGWALLGFGGGLLVAVAGIVAGLAARRRGRQH
jgi:hypothetical protein